MPGLTVPQNFPYPTYEEPTNVPQQIKDLADAVNFALVTTQNQIAAASNRPNAEIISSANQNIPNNALTNSVFGIEVFDNDNMANLGVDNTALTVSTTGFYVITGRCQFQPNATGNRLCRIAATGANPATMMTETSNIGETDIAVTAMMYATAGTVFRLAVLQNSGGVLVSLFRRMTAVRVSG